MAVSQLEIILLLFLFCFLFVCFLVFFVFFCFFVFVFFFYSISILSHLVCSNALRSSQPSRDIRDGLGIFLGGYVSAFNSIFLCLVNKKYGK